jgi:hypothetical protein
MNNMVLSAAWVLQKVLSLGGLLLALAGVATFGWHFVRINALAAQGDTNKIPPESWRGAGARYGLSILAAGVALAFASMILAAILPIQY